MTAVQELITQLAAILPADQLSVDPKQRKNNSQDYYWFSNVLEEDLQGYVAEVVVWPATNDQLAQVLAAAYAHGVPVTVRGGGTGNYGQCVPLRGGLVVTTERLNNVLEVGEGWARVQAGVRFVELDRVLAQTDQEVRIYPSTYLTATVAGFVAGGSGGVGSVTHGVLVDDNVLAATIMSMSETPVLEVVEGADMARYIHAYGTTGVLVDVTIPLSPRRRWEQAVVSVPTIEDAHHYCRDLLADSSIEKRLMTTCEQEVVRYFARSALTFDPSRAAVLLVFREGQRDAVMAHAEAYSGRLDITLPADSKHRLTDYAWNHTTLWAKKANRRAITYLQCGFDYDRFPEQVAAIRTVYSQSDLALHCEYILNNGAPFLAALPLVAYRGRDVLDRMVEFLEAQGVGIANPHRFVLEQGSRVENTAELVDTKRAKDPLGLLNPGKLAAWAPHDTGKNFRPATLGLAARVRRRPA